MSKELTTEPEDYAGNTVWTIVYAGQRKIYDEDERLKLEKIANEIGEYWGLEEPVCRLRNLLRKLHSRGFADMLAKAIYAWRNRAGTNQRSIGFGV